MLLRASLVVLGFVGSTATASGAEPSRDERFLDGLRDRGLFELAETYCRDRLAQTDLSDAERATLSIQGARSLADRAAGLPPDERATVWQQAQQVVDDFLQKHPKSPRRLLVALQGVLAHVARGELAREESEVVADAQPLLDEAVEELRAAVRQLEQLADEVDAELRAEAVPGASKPRTPADKLTADELVSLGANVRYQLARARRNQGQCFAADSPDRANSLTQAAQLLEGLAKLDSADPLAWRSRLDEIVCHRLLADHAKAQRLLEVLVEQKPPPAILLRARAEQLRLALDTRRLDDAVAMLALPRQVQRITSPEFDYARLETCLAAWQAAKQSADKPGAERWQNQAGETVRQIESDDGPYWTRRAEMLLARHFRGAVGGAGGTGNIDDVETLARAARSSYLSGRLDDAVATYDRAATLAGQHGELARALDLGYLAAMIQQKRGDRRAAMDRCRRLALSLSREAKAPEVHLQAILNAAQIAKEDAAGSLDEYEGLLEEHLRAWPQSPRLGQVLWWLGRLRQHAGSWPGAIAAYTRIPADDANHAAAVTAVGQCYRAWLAAQQDAAQPTAELAAKAAEWFESVFTPGGQLPERWSPAARDAALLAARFRLEYTPSGHARAEQILSAALAGAADAPPEWTTSARALLVSALAGQGRTEEARRQLQGIAAAGAEPLVEMLGGLERLSATAQPASRAELARLELQAVEMLGPRSDDLGQADRQTLQRVHARALADAGRADEALAMYAALAKQYPRDGQIGEAYAQLLSSRPDRASWEAALARWRDLETNSKPGGTLWFRAKYAVAELHCRLGNPEQAARMISLLRTLRPDLGGPEMKARFLTLLDRCGR